MIKVRACWLSLAAGAVAIAVGMVACGGSSVTSAGDAGGADARTDVTTADAAADSQTASDGTIDSGQDGAVDATDGADATADGQTGEGGTFDGPMEGGGDGGGGDGAADVVFEAPPAPPSVTFSAQSLDFGLTNCGGAPPAHQQLQLTNTGGLPLTWSASIPASSFTLLGTVAGSVAPGGNAKITVESAAVPATATAGAVTLTTMVITTNDPNNATVDVPVQITAQGATFALNPTTADFGQFSVGVQAPNIALTLTNTGNAAASVAFGAPGNPDFGVTYTGAPVTTSVAPGTSLPGAVATFRPSAPAQETTTAAIDVTGAVCGVSASTIGLTGQGYAGLVSVSPGSLNFGLTNCGSAAATQTFTVANTGNQSFSWTAALAKGNASPYTLSSFGGVLLANTAVTVTVTPAGIPATSAVTPNLYGDTLTITTNAGGDSPHVIPIAQTARGAIISLSASTIAFNVTNIGTPASMPLGVNNAGNASANVTFTPGTQSYAVTPSPMTVPASSTNNPATVTFTPVALGTVNDTITLSTSSVLCQPLPQPVTTTGTVRVTVAQLELDYAGNRDGNGTACALTTNGYVVCWGYGINGELGNGSLSSNATPQVVKTTSGFLTTATALTSAYHSFCALLSGGTVSCWGNFDPITKAPAPHSGSFYQQATAADIGLTSVTGIAAAHRSFCALVSGVGADGGITSAIPECWGPDKRGQSVVSGLANVTSMSMAGFGGCAAMGDGTAQCWGYDSKGQFGPSPSGNPSVVQGVSSVTQISTGGWGGRGGLVCALESDGSVWCWGSANRHGQLGPAGNGSTPTAVTGVTATAITVGSDHACAIVGGAAQCWGHGRFGALGNGASNDSSTPVNVINLAGVTQIAAGGEGTCAVSTGHVYCWGIIQATNQSIPTAVPGL
jgi:hypothetical protein